MSDQHEPASFVPAKQKAWVAVRKGTPSTALELKQDADVPKLAKGEVLVRVQAAALNPVGHKMLNMLPNFLARRPHVAEHDFTGVVADANDTKWKIGDEVYAFIPLPLQVSSHQGALAQYVKIAAERLGARPPSLKPTEAAGISLAGATAYRGLIVDAKLQEGQHVFINGGSTAVGIFAIQIAKAYGCTVTASASGRNEQFLKNLGVDRFIDYTKGPIHEQLEKDPPNPKFNVFIEAVGLSDILMYTRSEAYIAPGGVFLSVGFVGMGSGVLQYLRYFMQVMRPRFLGGTKRTWKLIMVDYVRKDWEGFTKLVTEGKVKGVIDSVYAFEDVLKAYERIMTSRATGKVVVKVDADVE